MKSLFIAGTSRRRPAQRQVLVTAVCPTCGHLLEAVCKRTIPWEESVARAMRRMHKACDYLDANSALKKETSCIL